MSLTGLLLTGGLSTRMGQEKATLVIDGQPLWLRQLNVLRGLAPEAVFISARSAPTWAPPGIPLVLDSPPSRGPLSGIAAALESLATSHLLVLAVDLPLMTSDHLRTLASLAALGAGVIPWNQQYFEPLAAIYPKTAAPFSQRAVASADFSLQSFARDLLRNNLAQRYTLSLQESLLYKNLNTLEDLAGPQS